MQCPAHEEKGPYFRYEMAGSDLVISSQERESWSYENSGALWEHQPGHHQMKN